ncbi:hypothetical protein KSP40_PGU012178 [Platanthera guangdongensis]|uniref:Uncharacterized protein n=1 Tax=Platanthera guangdongensis TaxID=2320717 RepID=A0ABR2MC38_9ASPA
MAIIRELQFFSEGIIDVVFPFHLSPLWFSLQLTSNNQTKFGFSCVDLGRPEWAFLSGLSVQCPSVLLLHTALLASASASPTSTDNPLQSTPGTNQSRYCSPHALPTGSPPSPIWETILRLISQYSAFPMRSIYLIHIVFDICRRVPFIQNRELSSARSQTDFGFQIVFASNLLAKLHEINNFYSQKIELHFYLSII